MKRLSGVLFAVGALLALATVAAGCGDDSDRQAREYFEEIIRIAGQHEADVQAAQAAQAAYEAAVEADAGDEEEVTAFLRLLETSSKSIRAETADREKVDPPPEIEEAHLDLLAAGRVLAKVYEDVVEGASGATTDAELQQALQAVDQGSRIEEAQGRAERACIRLQALATENGIETQVC